MPKSYFLSLFCLFFVSPRWLVLLGPLSQFSARFGDCGGGFGPKKTAKDYKILKFSRKALEHMGVVCNPATWAKTAEIMLCSLILAQSTWLPFVRIHSTMARSCYEVRSCVRDGPVTRQLKPGVGMGVSEGWNGVL